MLLLVVALPPFLSPDPNVVVCASRADFVLSHNESIDRASEKPFDIDLHSPRERSSSPVAVAVRRQKAAVPVVKAAKARRKAWQPMRSQIS